MKLGFPGTRSIYHAELAKDALVPRLPSRLMNKAVPVIFFHLDMANVGLALEAGWSPWAPCPLLLEFSPMLGRMTGARKVEKNNELICNHVVFVKFRKKMIKNELKNITQKKLNSLNSTTS